MIENIDLQAAALAGARAKWEHDKTLQWDDPLARPEDQDAYIDDARRVLEAGGPHIIAEFLLGLASAQSSRKEAERYRIAARVWSDEPILPSRPVEGQR